MGFSCQTWQDHIRIEVPGSGAGDQAALHENGQFLETVPSVAMPHRVPNRKRSAASGLSAATSRKISRRSALASGVSRKRRFTREWPSSLRAGALGSTASAPQTPGPPRAIPRARLRRRRVAASPSVALAFLALLLLILSKSQGLSHNFAGGLVSPGLYTALKKRVELWRKRDVDRRAGCHTPGISHCGTLLSICAKPQTHKRIPTY